MCLPRSPSVAQLEALADRRRRRRARANAWMCGSSRRRPITSPPGGGTLARPKRASSGPASRNEARIRLGEHARRARTTTRPPASTRTSFGPVHSTSPPMLASSSIIVSTSRMRGTFVSATGSLGEQARGEDRQGAVLVPGRRGRARSAAGRPRSRRTRRASLRRASGPRGGILARAVDATRDQAWETLTRYTQSEALRRHALAVEAAVGAYARQFRRGRGALAGRPRCCTTSTTRCTRRSTSTRRTAPRSCARRAIPRRCRGGALARRAPRPAARHAAEEDALRLRRAGGFIHACGLVRPDRARGARAEVGEEEAEAAVVRGRASTARTSTRAPRSSGIELDEHIAFVIDAMQPIAPSSGCGPAPRARRRAGRGRRRSSTSRTRRGPGRGREVADETPCS